MEALCIAMNALLSGISLGFKFLYVIWYYKNIYYCAWAQLILDDFLWGHFYIRHNGGNYLPTVIRNTEQARLDDALCVSA